MSFVDLVSADVQQVVQRFEAFHLRFSARFATRTRSMATQAKQYLSGQFICQGEDNLMEFNKWVPDTDYQSLHHFISSSPWEESSVIDDIAESVKHLIGSAEHGSLHIDESGIPSRFLGHPKNGSKAITQWEWLDNTVGDEAKWTTVRWACSSDTPIVHLGS